MGQVSAIAGAVAVGAALVDPGLELRLDAPDNPDGGAQAVLVKAGGLEAEHLRPTASSSSEHSMAVVACPL